MCAVQPTGLFGDVWTLTLQSVSVLVSLKGNLLKTEIMECDSRHLTTVLWWDVIASLSLRYVALLSTSQWIKRLWSFFETRLPRSASRKPPLGQHHHASAGFPPCFPCCCVFPVDGLPHLLQNSLPLALHSNPDVSSRLCFLLPRKSRLLWAGPARRHEDRSVNISTSLSSIQSSTRQTRSQAPGPAPGLPLDGPLAYNGFYNLK